MRLLIIFICLALVFITPFVLFGEKFESLFSGEAAVKWLRSFGPWAALMGILLLVSDLVLPVPATAVMAGLGILYGPVVGGLVGGLGSILSGLMAFLICKRFGRRAALFLAGEKDLVKGEAFFKKSGGWAVVLSRWAPLLPEVVSCMAGMMGMPMARFCLALICGSLPMAMTYAYLGSSAKDQPGLALLISALTPLLLWLIYCGLKRRNKDEITH